MIDVGTYNELLTEQPDYGTIAKVRGQFFMAYCSMGWQLINLRRSESPRDVETLLKDWFITEPEEALSIVGALNNPEEYVVNITPHLHLLGVRRVYMTRGRAVEFFAYLLINIHDARRMVRETPAERHLQRNDAGRDPFTLYGMTIRLTHSPLVQGRIIPVMRHGPRADLVSPPPIVIPSPMPTGKRKLKIL